MIESKCVTVQYVQVIICIEAFRAFLSLIPQIVAMMVLCQ